MCIWETVLDFDLGHFQTAVDWEFVKFVQSLHI